MAYLPEDYTLRIVTSGASVTFVAKASVGTSVSQNAWQVKKIDETSGTIITWADGDRNFDNFAYNLPSLTYS